MSVPGYTDVTVSMRADNWAFGAVEGRSLADIAQSARSSQSSAGVPD